MPRRLVWPLVILLCLTTFVLGAAGAESGAGTVLPEPSATASVLMDRESRRVLWQENPHQQRPIASLTKIMTALVALQYGDETKLVRISSSAAETGGSSIWLEEGEEKTGTELLYGLILRSGNDAATAVAEDLAGSIESFAALMNFQAGHLGAVNTNFCNPHGLHHDQHYSTAYDQALIASFALDNPRFREIASTVEYSISWPGKPWDRLLVNQNRLLQLYAGGDGIKTGWTDQAGRCFAGSATRDGWQLVAVVLNAPLMWEDAIALLDYGFSTYQRVKLAAAGDPRGAIPIVKGFPVSIEVGPAEDFYYPLLPEERSRIRWEAVLPPSLVAPVLAGTPAGWLEFYLEEEQIGRITLVTGEDVPRLSTGQHFMRLGRLLLRSIV